MKYDELPWALQMFIDSLTAVYIDIALENIDVYLHITNFSCSDNPMQIQSALVIRTTFVPLCFSERNVLITSATYECSYSQRNYLVFWKSVPMADVDVIGAPT